MRYNVLSTRKNNGTNVLSGVSYSGGGRHGIDMEIEKCFLITVSSTNKNKARRDVSRWMGVTLEGRFLSEQ